MTAVIVVVFDGLQPAQVIPRLMPNLTGFIEEGVTFNRHHPVFPSVTRANAASMVTGQYTGGHGLAANRLMIREFDAANTIPALEPELTSLAKKTGRVLLVPTLGEILAESGQEYIAIGVGTSGNAYLHHPNAEVVGGATIHPDFTLPRSLQQEITARFGPWPEMDLPNTARFAYAVRVMTEFLLPERDPQVALLWSSEPDKAQHDAGVGSPLSDAAIREADQQFGQLIGWLEQTGRLDTTDLMVVSDHGYSTITEVIDVETELRTAGFPPGGQPGGVAMAPNGGAALFYTHQQDQATARRLAAWLMEQPWCGNLLASEAAGDIPGALPAALAGVEGPRAPEIIVSLGGDSQANAAGYSGRVFSTGGSVGVGQHGSMNPSELRNILFARGPSFRRGLALNSPSGNIDLLPTILRILGKSPAEIAGLGLAGRALEEAMWGGSPLAEADWTVTVREAETKLPGGTYRQSVSLAQVGTTSYLEQGSAQVTKG